MRIVPRNLVGMTVESRLASLVMPRLDADQWHDASYRQQAYALIDRGVRAFGLFSGTLAETAAMIGDLQRHIPERLFLGADYEYGLPMRLRDGGIAFPRAMALGATSPGITEHIASAIAREMRALGVHWNWAPVADMNSNRHNPIVNTRAFGENPDAVSPHVAAFVRGLQSGGVLACAKHVPGHGATTVDSHLSLPVLTLSRSDLECREYLPFQAAITADVGSLMMGHLMIPALDPALPASLSAEIVTGLVRTEWGFDGLITTDALDMGAITTQWTSGQAAVLAVVAGCDVVLLPADPDAAIDALVEAALEGRISEDHIAKSERRWQSVRRRYGRTDSVLPVDQQAHAMMALQAASVAIHVAGDPTHLPLQQFERVAVFAVIDERDADTATTWFHYLAQATELDIDMGYIDGTIADRDLAGLIEGTQDAEVVVFAFFGRAVAHRGGVAGGIPGQDRLAEVLDALSAGRPRIVVAAGSPYGIDEIASDCTLLTYSDTVPSLAASVLRLIGREPQS